MRECSIKDCEKSVFPEDAFEARTEPLVGDPGCVVWTGTIDRSGYGKLYADGRMVSAHRYSWERVNGPIPDGMVIDHKCWERSCVLPDHMRLATRAQNNQSLSGLRRNRGDLPRGVARDGRGYRARVRHNGTDHHLGTYPTPEEASAVASVKRKELFGEFAGAA